MLRCIWGWNRLQLVGGKFTERDNNGNAIREIVTLRGEPKYPTILNRWIIEQWIAPEKLGTPESWYAATKDWKESGTIPQLGPYPARGDYWLFTVFEDDDGSFLQLTDFLVTKAALLYLKLQKNPLTLADEQAKLRKGERDYDNWASDFVADGTPAYFGNPHVTVL